MGSSSFQSSNQCEIDSQHLHSYLSGNGVVINNHQNLVEILTCRNLNEIKSIRQRYSALYGQDLLHDFARTQRTNPFASVAYLRICEPQERDSELIRGSLFGASVDLNMLIEITCSRSSSQLQAIKQSYSAKYKSDIEQDVSTRINGGFKEILLAVLKSCRNYGGKVDMSMAMCDAKTMYEAIESGKTVDAKTIISLLSQRNTGQLRAMLNSYKQLYGCEFSRSIKQTKCGQFGKQFRIAIRCIRNPEKFFAKQLRMTNAGAREILIRIIVTRAEVDIKEINKVFMSKNGNSIENLVKKEFNNKKDNNSCMVSGILIKLVRGY